MCCVALIRGACGQWHSLPTDNVYVTCTGICHTIPQTNFVGPWRGGGIKKESSWLVYVCVCLWLVSWSLIEEVRLAQWKCERCVRVQMEMGEIQNWFCYCSRCVVGGFECELMGMFVYVCILPTRADQVASMWYCQMIQYVHWSCSFLFWWAWASLLLVWVVRVVGWQVMVDLSSARVAGVIT